MSDSEAKILFRHVAKIADVSAGDARRLIRSGRVLINGIRVCDENANISNSDLIEAV